MINGKILYENGRYNISEDIKDIYHKMEEISQRIESEL